MRGGLKATITPFCPSASARTAAVPKPRPRTRSSAMGDAAETIGATQLAAPDHDLAVRRVCALRDDNDGVALAGGEAPLEVCGDAREIEGDLRDEDRVRHAGDAA